MKKLLIGLAVVAVILAVVLGIQVGQTNKLNADLDEQKANVAALVPLKDEIEVTKTQLETLTAEKEALTAELQSAQKNQEELTSQIKELTDPTVLADSSKLEADYANLLSQYNELTLQNQEFSKQQVVLSTKAEDESNLRSDVEAQLKTANDQINSFVDTIKATEKAKTEAIETAEKTKADALNEAEDIKTKALKEAEDIKAEAAKSVEATKADALQQVETVKADALKQVEDVRAEAMKTVEDSQAEASKAAETAKAEVSTILDTKVEADAKATQEKITELEGLIAAANEKAAELDAKLQIEINDKNAALEAVKQLETASQTAETAAVVAEVTPEAIAATFAPAGDKSKASIWHTFTKGQEAYLQKAVADFNASQGEYQIELLSQPYEGFLGSVRSAVVEGIGPDIIFNYASEAASYVKPGLVADLGQYIYDDEIGIKDFEGSLVDGVMNGEVKAFEDGLIHYLPAYTTGPIFFYNKTLFEELDLKVPTTWEEMETVSKAIFDAKGIPALGFDSLTDLVQMFIMETPGAGYIDVENKQVLFDTPEVRAKMAWLIDMVKQGYFLVKPTGNYFSEDFNSGIVAGYIGSSAGYPYIKPADDSFQFGMAPVPAQTWFPSWNRGPIVFYYKDDMRAQAAYEFVKYFITPEVNAGWTEAVVALAPYSWTKDNEGYKAFIAQDTLEGQALQAVEANLDIAGSLPAVEGANVVRDALKAAIEKAALGDMSVEDAWTEAVTVSNAALKGE